MKGSSTENLVNNIGGGGAAGNNSSLMLNESAINMYQRDPPSVTDNFNKSTDSINMLLS